MFTGLVESVGRVETVAVTEAGVEFRVAAELENLELGESVSVNGVCLTVLDRGQGWFTVAAMTMTIGRTTLGEWIAGKRVNLERAMRTGSRLGGHIVQGHADGVALVDARGKSGDAVLLDMTLPEALSETLVLHGSVAIDGVSLTVNRLEGDKLQVALIDYTLRHTALGELQSGSRVNVETDVIGKYVKRLVAPYLNR